jgi:uncharacterized protein YbaP (TraB family)
MRILESNVAQSLLSPFMDVSTLLNNQLAPINQTDTSILIDGFLTNDSSQESAHELNALQTARDLLEHGQVDKARSILEFSVMCGESNLHVHQDLLEIYQQTNDKTNFSKVLNRLDKKGRNIPSIWQDLVAFFDAPTHLIYG